METVSKMILAIISFLIIFFVVGFLLIPTMNDSYKDAVCKFSLYLASYSRGGIPLIDIKTGSAFNLNCPVHNKKISTTDDEKILNLVAKESVNCWAKLGEGKVDFYADLSFPWDQGDVLCVICSKIEPKSSKYDAIIPASDFMDYLSNEQYTKEKLTYLEYLAGGQGDLPGALMSESSSISITSEKPLYVVFAVDKSEGIGTKIGRVFGLENEDIAAITYGLFRTKSGGTKTTPTTPTITAGGKNVEDITSELMKGSSQLDYEAKQLANAGKLAEAAEKAKLAKAAEVAGITKLTSESKVAAKVATKIVEGTVEEVAATGAKRLIFKKVLTTSSKFISNKVFLPLAIVDIGSSVFASKDFNARLLYLNSEEAANVCDELVG